MNERIQALADEAEDYADGIVDQGGDFHPAYTKKFAELIAKECAVLAMTEHHSTSPAEYDEMESYEQGCDDTASAISGKIRRIFGVE